MDITPEQIENLRITQIAESNAQKLDRAKRMQNYHPLHTIFAATIAGIVELIFLYPFEFIKTHSQFSPGVTKYSTYHTPMRAAVNYMKERGIHGFYIGSQPLMFASFCKAFVRMSTYDLTAKQSNPSTKRKWFPLYGIIAATLECLVSLPFENIKNHMTHSAYMRVLEPGQQTFIKLVEQRGLKAFLRGFWPSIWSYSIMYSVRMSAFTMLLPMFDKWAAERGKKLYDDMKIKATKPEYEHLFRKADGSFYEVGEYNYIRPTIGTWAIGTIATVSSVVLTMPLDQIKTKLQSPERPLYRGTVHCLTQSIKHFGFKSLWRGTTPRAIRAVFATPIYITVYEELLEKVGSSGPHGTTSMGRLDA
jgi:hypothetical protein